MSNIGRQSNFTGGIGWNRKEGPKNSVYFTRGLDTRSDNRTLTLSPKAVFSSGSVIKDLVLSMTRAYKRIYMADQAGNIYLKDTTGYKLVHTISNSKGHAIKFYPEQQLVFYCQDRAIGKIEAPGDDEKRKYTDDYMNVEGGKPNNINVMNLNGGKYLVHDIGSILNTTDFAYEIYTKFNSFPTDDGIMTIAGRWSEDLKIWRLALEPTYSFFRSGKDGAVIFTADNQDDWFEADANFNGAAGDNYIEVSNITGTFEVGQTLLLIQLVSDETSDTSPGNYESTYPTITAIDGNKLYLNTVLANTYVHDATTAVGRDGNYYPVNLKAYCMVLKQYTDVTVSSGAVLSPAAWDGLKGGVIGFFANGTCTISGGTITAAEKGFRGGQGFNLGGWIGRGEGNGGNNACDNNGGGLEQLYRLKTNGNGAGGGEGTSGAGGGQKYKGVNGKKEGDYGTEGGDPSGDANGTTINLGGGGSGSNGNNSFRGGRGGGIICLNTRNLVATIGLVSVNGEKGSWKYTPPGWDDSGSGGGAAGTIILNADTADIGTEIFNATGGNGGIRNGTQNRQNGGAGSEGWIVVRTASSFTGTAVTEVSESTIDSLGEETGKAIVLRIRNADDEEKSISYQLTSEQPGEWNRWSVSFQWSTGIAKIFQTGVLKAESAWGEFTPATGDVPLIIGADTADGDEGLTAVNLIDAKVDDLRFWNDNISDNDITYYASRILNGDENFLESYLKLDNSYADEIEDRADVVPVGSPEFTDDVPFYGFTSRLTTDQRNDATGQDYTLKTSLSEDATDKYTFIPTRDPQRSVMLHIDTVGTGNWTLTVHDADDKLVATKTISAASVKAGYFEVEWDESWSPIFETNYHLHVFSTVADGIVDVGTSGSMADLNFQSFFRSLTDSVFHPQTDFSNLQIFGNGRYVATMEPGDYDPHRLTFPKEYEVRCFTRWGSYLAIGLVKYGDLSQPSILALWDGASDKYNQIYDIEEGGINAMIAKDGVIHMFVGVQGDWLVYSADTGVSKFRRLPKLELKESATLNPEAISLFQSFVAFGVGSECNSKTIEKGVYTYGKNVSSDGNGLTLDYPLSLGPQTNNAVQVGALFQDGKDLYVSWKSGSMAGVDLINYTNPFVSTGEIETLLVDWGETSLYKLPISMSAEFNPLKPGTAVRLKYSLDRGQTWSYGKKIEDEGAFRTRLTILGLARELQCGVQLFSNGTYTPEVIELTLEAADSTARKRN